MTQLTTAFLGVAHIHTPGFISRLNSRADDVRVKSVFDRDEERGKRRAAEIDGAEYVRDPELIFNDHEIDSVIICSETVYHKHLVIDAALAGKHIFCEKPLGIRADDAAAMADAVKAANVLFQTGFFQRSSPSSQFIRQEVLSGNLGKITRARFSNCHQAALAGWFDTEWRWLADKNLAGGGALLDMGAHPLDLVQHILRPTQGEIVNIASAVGNRVGRYGPEIDEYGTGLLTFASGASAIIEASWVDPSLRSATEVFGTEGQILVRDGDVYYYSAHVDGADGTTPVTRLPTAAPHAFDLFWDALLGKPLPIDLVTIEEAMQGTAVMEELYKAAGRR